MSFERRARWMMAQLGRKPGRHSSEDLLLDVADVTDAVGGHWEKLDGRTWRTGEGDREAPWAQRARGMASVTAWRSFGNKAESRWIWCQVVPLASASDVGAAARDIADKAIPNRSAKVKLVSTREIEVAELSGAVFLFGREQQTAGSTGAGFSYLLGFGVGSVLAVVSYSGTTTLGDAVAVADALSWRVQERHEGIADEADDE